MFVLSSGGGRQYLDSGYGKTIGLIGSTGRQGLAGIEYIPDPGRPSIEPFRLYRFGPPTYITPRLRNEAKKAGVGPPSLLASRQVRYML